MSDTNNVFEDEFQLLLANGGALCTDNSEINPEGASYVRVINSAGDELAYWSVDEWAEDPELVMGAIIGACAKAGG